MLEAIAAFLIGLLIGSFLNVCIYRLPRDMSVVRPRSFCPACDASIAWYDNIPVFSYLLLGGRCRQCRARIPLRYPVVELLTGISFFVTVLTLGFGPLALKWCLFEALALGLLFSDLEQRILPDEMTLGGAVAGILLSLVVPMERGYAPLLTAAGMSERSVSVIESLLGAILGSGLLWLIGFLYNAVRHKDGLGLGDVKMMAMIGSFMGLQGALQTLILASLVGSVIGLIYIRLAKKDFSTYELPFGTFLGAIAFLLALLRGPFSS